MKKIFAIVLALALVLSLAACGGAAKPAETKVSVFWYDEADVYLSTVRSALNEELDALGVEYDNQFAANDQAKQLDQVKPAIAGGSTLLVVNLVTSGSVDAAEEILFSGDDEELAEMAKAMTAELMEKEALMPTFRATGKAIPYPDQLVNRR